MLRPMRDQVLVEKVEADEYKGMVILPDAPNQSRGKILAVSNSEEVFEVGDDIMFGKNSGMVLEFEGAEHLLIKTSDIMAKIENN